MLLPILLCLLSAPTHALAATDDMSDDATQIADDAEVQGKIKEFESSLKYQQGAVTLSGGLAKINVPEQFHYLDHANTVKVLEAWGNENVGETLGMLLPAKTGPLANDSWGIVINYEEDGHINDDNAKSIDYTKLMEQMKEGTAKINEERKKKALRQIELLGWAAPPTYDSATHKMYWAKELRFEDAPSSTLNYDIRILGKEGVLVLSAVAPMAQLPMIQKEIPSVLSFVDFAPGHAYADYKPGVHKLASYGLTGLIAGGVVATAAKAGFFKALVPILLAGKKFVLLALAAVAGAFRRFFGRRKATVADAPVAMLLKGDEDVRDD